jgi:hypothetical protein
MNLHTNKTQNKKAGEGFKLLSNFFKGCLKLEEWECEREREGEREGGGGEREINKHYLLVKGLMFDAFI